MIHAMTYLESMVIMSKKMIKYCKIEKYTAVILDTYILINLAKIDRLYLLSLLF